MEHHAEGTGEKVWAHRRSKTPLLGRVRGRGAAGQRNLPEHVCWGSQRAGHLWHRLWVTGNFLCGLRAEPGLSATWCLLRDLQAAGTDRGGQSSQRPEVGMACHHWGPVSGLHLWPQSSQRSAKKKKKKKRENTDNKPPLFLLSPPWAHPPTKGGPGAPTTRGPSHLRGGQKKKKKKKERALQPNPTCSCSHPPGNTPTLQLPVPNALGSVQTLDHCPFPRPYN